MLCDEHKVLRYLSGEEIISSSRIHCILAHQGVPNACGGVNASVRFILGSCCQLEWHHGSVVLAIAISET
jgi:hypothetical protein